MNKNTNANLKYIQQIGDIVARTGQLLPAFKKAYEDGNIDMFRKFIHDYNLQEVFVQNSFVSSLKFSSNEEMKCFDDMALEEGLVYLSKTYGNEFGDKLRNLYKDGKLGLYDIYAISNINKTNDIQKQSNIMMKILDLYNDDNLIIGIHRTGQKNIGETINRDGLRLTGNLSSGIGNQDYEDVMDELEDNISFDNGPGSLLLQIATGGQYKNYLDEKFIDISIIAIPKMELEERRNITINDEEIYGGTKLNPRFIKGYITVDSQNSTLSNYVENPLYLSQETSMTTYKKQNKFITWIQEKFSNIKNRLSKNNSNHIGQSYANNQEEKNSKKNNFINTVTQNGKLRSKEQQMKSFEVVKKWIEQSKQKGKAKNSTKDRLD